MKEAQRKDAEIIMDFVHPNLQPIPKHKMLAVGFDGTNSMSGVNGGVQALFQHNSSRVYPEPPFNFPIFCGENKKNLFGGSF